MGQIKIEQIVGYYQKVTLEPPAHVICLLNSNGALFLALTCLHSYWKMY